MATPFKFPASDAGPARPARKARPTGERFDAVQALDRTMARFSKVMTRLAE